MGTGKSNLWTVKDLEMIVKWFVDNLTMFTGDETLVLTTTTFAFNTVMDYIAAYVKVHECGFLCQ
jgi:hypothetical protein